MESTQFEKGQLVIYSTNGICVIESIENISFSSGMPKELYYVLRQQKNKDNKYFVPVNNENLTNKIRDLMQKEEIEDMLMGLTMEDMQWIDDRRERQECFKAILRDGVSSRLLSMIICIYRRKRMLDRDGKKLPTTDGNTLKSAEKLVEEEFGWVLGLDKEQVPQYIRKRLHIPEE